MNKDNESCIPYNCEHVEAMLREMEALDLLYSEVDQNGVELWELTEKGESYMWVIVFFLEKNRPEFDEDKEE